MHRATKRDMWTSSGNEGGMLVGTKRASRQTRAVNTRDGN